jgi:hypothetical protein
VEVRLLSSAVPLFESAFLAPYPAVSYLSNVNCAATPIIDLGVGIVNREWNCGSRIMLEIALNFEEAAAGFEPMVLIVPGLLAVLAGLFIWLGGFGIRKVLVAVIGAVSGWACGFFMTGGHIILVVVFAVVAAVIAVMFEDVCMRILAVAVAVVCGFSVLAGPYIKGSFTLAAIEQACSLMPLFSWAVIAALAVIFIVGGIFFWRLTLALCCAALGTILIFAGMISLLLYKGAMPISNISSRLPFYGGVFMAMVAFGTLGQLLLCRANGKKPVKKRHTGKGERAVDEESPKWRTL